MSENINNKKHFGNPIIITAGSTYLDIDAYACCIAMSELLRLQGKNALAYSDAACNYSVCKSLIVDGQMADSLPPEYETENSKYIIVDVSDPEYIKNSVPLDKVVSVYDHHVGFEEYWKERIGENSHIEFLGAAATLIYREWKEAGLQDKMSHSTALLLIAAILDNTLNLTSTNTTDEDAETFNELCKKGNINKEWCASYFSEAQTSIEVDLKNALFSDIKTISDNNILPSAIAQLCIWDACSILKKLPEIRQCFDNGRDSWMINIIDIKHQCSYFVCDANSYKKEIERIFNVRFESGVAKSSIPYLRKEIIKKAYFDN